MPRARAAAEHVVAKIVDSGRDIHGKIIGGKQPSMKFPLPSLSKVRYTPKKAYFEMVGKKKERTLTVSTVRTFVQTLRLVTPQLRDGRVPAGEAEAPREVPALTAREPR